MIRRDAQTGFTLIELMVSIALMLLIMVGVNIVFTTTSTTVGVNNAIGTTNRDARAVHAVLQQDLANLASDSPAMVIRCEQGWVHNNRTEWNADPTNANAATADLTGAGTETTLSAAIYNSRSHRKDRLSFFTRRLQQRQTGNDGTFIADQSAMEQWVWWGHASLPNNDLTAFFGPGLGTADTNSNNYFAQSWSLARVGMLLIEPTSGGYIDAPPGTHQEHYSSVSGGNTAPLSNDALATDSTPFYRSRYDLAGTSISTMGALLSGLPAGTNWWDEMMGGPKLVGTVYDDQRFQAVAFPARPLTAAGVAKVSPIVAANCSQFAIEFAGDFVKQNPDGTVADAYFDPGTLAVKADGSGQDGLIDFAVLGTGANTRQVIRWYGLPRDTTNDGVIKTDDGDVTPLRDTIRRATGFGSVNATVERASTASDGGGVNLLSSIAYGASTEYAAAMAGTGTPPKNYFYTVAFGPGDSVRPKLIRVVLTLDDANGRLPAGQTFEYVFTLP